MAIVFAIATGALTSIAARGFTSHRTMATIDTARTLTSRAIVTGCIPAPTMRAADKATLPNALIFTVTARAGFSRSLQIAAPPDRLLVTAAVSGAAKGYT